MQAGESGAEGVLKTADEASTAEEELLNGTENASGIFKSKFNVMDANQCQAEYTPGNSQKGGGSGYTGQTDNKGILVQGERVFFCMAKSKDKLLLTSHRLIHVDGSGGLGTRFVKAKPKVEYISYMYRVINNFEVTTAGSFELFRADSELIIELKHNYHGRKAPEGCSGGTPRTAVAGGLLKGALMATAGIGKLTTAVTPYKCQFDFDKKVNILAIGKFMSTMLKHSMTEQRAAAIAFVKSDLRKMIKARIVPGPIGSPHAERFMASTTGRLENISLDAANAIVKPMLMKGEEVQVAFKFKKSWLSEQDCVVVTNNRILLADQLSRVNKKLTVKSNWFPEMSIEGLMELLDRSLAVWSVRTAGKFDKDSEMWFQVEGVGKSYGEFWKETDTIDLYQKFSEFVLKNKIPLNPDGSTGSKSKGEKKPKGSARSRGSKSSARSSRG